LGNKRKKTRELRAWQIFPRTNEVARFQHTETRMIDFLEEISAGLRERQTVGEEFTQERLIEMSAEFNLTDSEWGELYCMIHRVLNSA
jgi:hypothetical protein